MKKRLLATLLSLVMVLTMLPVSAFAALDAANLTVTAKEATTENDGVSTTTVTLTVADAQSGDALAAETKILVKTTAQKTTPIPESIDAESKASYEEITIEENKAITFEKTTADHGFVEVAVINENSNNEVTQWGTAAIQQQASGLDVKAVRAGEEPDAKATLTVKKTEGNADVEGDLYYRISQEDTAPTAQYEGDAITVGNVEGNWTEYAEASFALTAEDKYIEVVTVTEGEVGEDGTKPKLVALWGYAEITDPVAALGELTVTVTNNVIAVTKDDEDVTTNLVYYKADQAKIGSLATEKAKWNADTALTVVTEFFTEASKLTLEDATITEDEDGSFIVAVQTDAKGEKVVAVGATGAAVEFKDNSALPFQLYAGEVTTPGAGDTDLMTDVTESSGKYAVTVPAGTTKVSVVGDVTVAKNVDSDTTITVNGKVVTLAESGASTFKVSTTDPSADYVVEVTKAAPDYTKPGIVINSSLTVTSGDVLAADAAFTADETADDTYNASASVSSTATEVYVTTTGTVTVDTTNGADWDNTNKKVKLSTNGNTTTITVELNSKSYVITLTKESGGTDTVATLTIETAIVDEDGNVTLVVKKAGNPISAYWYKIVDNETAVGTKPTTPVAPSSETEYTEKNTSNGITDGAAGKYIVVVELSEGNIVSWGSKVLTAETPVVSEFTALTVKEGTGADAGKLMVTVADGEVPDGLQYVILNSDPQWTKDTTADAVNEALTGKEPQAYVEGTTKVPDQTNADQYVVVYKLGQEKLEAYGMLKVAAQEEERLITVKANNEGDSLIASFDKDTTDYTVVVAQSVSSITVAASEGGAITDGNDNSGVVDKPADAETKGAVSTVKVTFGETVYTITLLWPKDKDAIDTPDTEVKPTVDANSEEDKSTVDLTTNAAEETKVLVAIGNTAAMNEGQAQKAPVSIDATATTPANATATTEVKLPVAVSNALVETEVPVEIKTDAGTVTLPSVAIEKAQGDEADVLTVVVENTSAETVQPEDDVRASFKVTIEKNGVATEDVTGLAEANWITLVFAVPNTVIDGVDEPILAWDDNGTYKELESSDYEKGATETVFTAKTSHLTDFVVIGKALLSPAPSTDEFAISVQGEELVPGFSAGVLNYEVKTDATSATIEVKNPASGSTVTVNGQTYSAPVVVTVTEGTKVEVVYTLNGATTGTKYTITFKKKTQEAQPPTEVIIGDDENSTPITFVDGKATVDLKTQSSFTFTVPADTNVTTTGGVIAKLEGTKVTVTATANGTVKFTLNGTEYTLNVTKTPASQTGSYTMEWKYMKFADAANQFKQVTLKNTDANKVYLVEVIDSNYGSGQNNFLVVDGNGNDVSFYLLKSASRVKVWEVVEADFVNATGDGINYPQSVNPGILDLA